MEGAKSKPANVRDRASRLTEGIKFLRAEIDHSARLFAIIDSGSDDATVDALNGQDLAFAQTCGHVQNSVTTTAALILCRAFDTHPDKTTVAFPPLMELLRDSETRMAAAGGEDAEEHFQKALVIWDGLSSRLSQSSLIQLGKVIRAADRAEQQQLLEEMRKKHSLHAVVKDLRNSVLAHNAPKKAEKAQPMGYGDAKGLLSFAIDLIDHLSAATGTTTVSVRHTLDIWEGRGQAFWKRLARPE